jgi:hypothetical protein
MTDKLGFGRDVKRARRVDDDLETLEGPTLGGSGTRGFSRSKATFRRTNRPHYDTLQDLKRAHWRIFLPHAKLFIIGELLSFETLLRPDEKSTRFYNSPASAGV